MLFLLARGPCGFYKFLEYCIDRYIVSLCSSGLKSCSPPINDGGLWTVLIIKLILHTGYINEKLRDRITQSKVLKIKNCSFSFLS